MLAKPIIPSLPHDYATPLCGVRIHQALPFPRFFFHNEGHSAAEPQPKETSRKSAKAQWIRSFTTEDSHDTQSLDVQCVKLLVLLRFWNEAISPGIVLGDNANLAAT